MYPHQAERLSEALDAAQVEGLVATSPENVAYVTGFRSVAGQRGEAPEFGVFTRSGTALVVPAQHAASIAADAIDVDHVVCFGEWRVSVPEGSSPEVRRLQEIRAAAAPGPLVALAAALDRLGVRHGSIGVDESHLTRDAWEGLTAGIAGAKIGPAAAHLAVARRVKGPYEIECMGHALRIAEEALDAVIQTIDRGMTEREAAALFASEVLKRGAWPQRPVVMIGERTGIPASWPTDSALRAGDLVRFDMGCIYKGYCSSVGRTAVLGEPSSSQEALSQAVRAGLEAAIAAVKAGGPAGPIFDAAVEAIRGHGIPNHHTDHCGHGIGLQPHEVPLITFGNRATLELGEVLCIEASHYQVGVMGVGVRNTVLVTTTGARALNRSYHGLVALD
ncbi:MAG TPA: Xaa-Pro peptidase family protein [Candidatus Methylomirabilis sp.]|nr:Xaa-Pro peptidase family protein [Candidatus Methylomirabilis sp.]